MGGSGAKYGRNGKLTADEMARKVKKEESDAYLFDVEYEKLKHEREEIEKEYAKAREEYLRITEELRQEISEGNASQSDMARYMSVLTDRGVQLQEEQQKLQKTIDGFMEQQADVERRMNELRKNAFSGATNAYASAERNNYKGFTADAQKSRYVNARLVEMRPEEYLRRIAFDFKGNGLQDLVKGLSPSAVERYMKAMERGTKYKSPSLDYRGKKTSGAEKALAALLNGYERIPVMIVE